MSMHLDDITSVTILVGTYQFFIASDRYGSSRSANFCRVVLDFIVDVLLSRENLIIFQIGV